MGLLLWITLYALECAFTLWVVRGDGARRLEGWSAALLLGALAGRWNAEQLRLYCLLLWLCHSVWFVLGVFMPQLRGE